jgi:hypothetical protein
LITSSKIAKVRKSGELGVRVSDEGSDGRHIDMGATLKGKTLASKSGLTVKAGTAKPVTLKLSKAGKKALKGLDKATIKLAADVEFGLSAKTRRTLK